MHDEVCKIESVDPLKEKSIPELKVKPQSSLFRVEEYYSSDSSSPSPREAVFSQSEAKSSRTIIMSAMICNDDRSY